MRKYFRNESEIQINLYIHSIPNSATISDYLEGTFIWYNKNLLFEISSADG